MREAAANADPAQAFQDLIERAAHMQQNRQIEITGNLQLFDKKVFLARCIKTRNKVIQPDLSKGNGWTPAD